MERTRVILELHNKEHRVANLGCTVGTTYHWDLDLDSSEYTELIARIAKSGYAKFTVKMPEQVTVFAAKPLSPSQVLLFALSVNDLQKQAAS